MPRPTKLTPEILRECIERRKKGEKNIDLAEEFDVSPGTLKVQLSKFRKSLEESHEKSEKLHQIHFEDDPKPKPQAKPKETKPIARPQDTTGLNKEITGLKDIIKLLEDRIYHLETNIPIRKRGGTGKKSPSQDKIMELLNDGELLTYYEIADRLNCTHSVVCNSASRLLEKNLIQKFESKERIASGKRTIIRIRKFA